MLKHLLSNLWNKRINKSLCPIKKCYTRLTSKKLFIAILIFSRAWSDVSTWCRLSKFQHGVIKIHMNESNWWLLSKSTQTYAGYRHSGGSRGRLQEVHPPPELRPSSSYWLLKFVYLTSQLCHSLMAHPLPNKNPGSAPETDFERWNMTVKSCNSALFFDSETLEICGRWYPLTASHHSIVQRNCKHLLCQFIHDKSTHFP